MPINTPIKDRKIAPNSLAFPQTGTSGGGATTYQQTLQSITNNVTVYADTEELKALRANVGVLDRDAEYRSKAWVGDWHRVIDWDITTTIEITNSTWSPITYANEGMRAMGAYYSSAGSDTWFWTIPDDWDGTWFLYAHLSISVQAAAAVTFAQLGILVNGTLRTVLDRSDIEMAGDHAAHMRDVILGGGRNISVQVGDIVTVCVFLAGAVGSDTYTNPTSVTGYVSGHRTMCGFGHIINSQDDNNGYTFI